MLLADSTSTVQDYVNRTKELGQTILSSCNHGGSYNWKETQMIAEENDLRFRYVVEAYFVKDRRDKEDRTNTHMILAAKTEKGIGDLNEIISEANISGYYYRPRIDWELLYRLDHRNVFVTTACVGGIWRYGNEDAEKIVTELKGHFRDSFMLEVQYHNTDKQVEVNSFILSLYRKYNIPIIMGTDSHVIYPEQTALRELRLEANHIKYENEDGWYFDYPDEDECVKRFYEQGVLSNAHIKEAIENTNIFLTFDDVHLDKSRKLPNCYHDMTQDERNALYRKSVLDGYTKWYGDVTVGQRDRDMAELEYEMDAITETNTSDYFLSLVEIVKEAKKRGGVLTMTGRGSGASFATNRMLGLTSVNRLRVPVTMYPDRFISKDRLASGSLPDLDINLSGFEAFQQAGKAVLGEWGCVQMIAYGKLRASSAWKMYARAENIPFEESNAVSNMIKAYETALKYAEEDEQEEILLRDFITDKYIEQVEASVVYQGIVNSVSPHCGHMLFDGDIRREIGVMRLKDKGDNPVFATMLDGTTADKCGYVKADFLRVDVVKLNNEGFKAAGIEQPTADRIVELTKNDAATWSMYEKGYTVGLNQCERSKSTARVMQYKPRSIVELSAFIAAIRPAFQSMLEIFLGRQRYSFGIPSLDKVVQTPEMPSSFLLYQEQVFTILMKAGISGSDAYKVIKAISKKKSDVIHSFMAKFTEGFMPFIMADGKTTNEEAVVVAEKVWRIIEDSASYSFNSSHAYCVALDSLYSAYLKAHYPYEFYVSALRVYGEKQDKGKLSRIKNEMRQAFGIKVAPPKFGQDNRDFFADKQAGTISDTLSSAKFVSRGTSETLYHLGQNKYEFFVDLLKDIAMAGAIDRRQQEILINMGYFRDFGNEGKLSAIFEEFQSGESRFDKKHKPATQDKRIVALRDIEAMTDGEPMPFHDKLKFETEYLGSPISTFPDRKGAYTIIAVDTQYSPKLDMYNIASGTTGRMKMRKATYMEAPVVEGDTILLKNWEKKPAYAYVDGKPQKKRDEYELWIQEYAVVS